MMFETEVIEILKHLIICKMIKRFDINVTTTDIEIKFYIDWHL
jgi:hypothetical protein